MTRKTWSTIWLMPTVSDTSPILNLARIGRSHLLHEQFGEVYIPSAVAQELRALAKNTEDAKVRLVLNESWLITVPLKSTVLARRLQLELDDGESEAIALALEASAETVLMDEHDGRQVALHLGLNVTGVMGVLIRAKKLARIPAIVPEIERLRQQANFFISKKLIQQTLAACGENA